MTPSKPLSAAARLIAQKNIGHYDQHAASYFEGTKDHDVLQNIDALLRAIANPHHCVFWILVAVLGVTYKPSPSSVMKRLV